MLSINVGRDAQAIAAEVRVERMVHKGCFVLLEGKTDIARFRPFISSVDCSIINCNSVQHVVESLKILEDEGISRILAIIDADFSRVVGENRTTLNTIVSENHDLDLDWINTNCLDRYLDREADEAKVKSLGGKEAIIKAIHKTLRPVSYARLLNHKKIFTFKVSKVKVANFYSHKADILSDYVSALININNNMPEKNWIESEIKKEMNIPQDNWQMTNGHDLYAALGKMLQSDIGSRNRNDCAGKQIEKEIRSTFNANDFSSLELFNKILAWEKINVGFRVIAPPSTT